MAWFCFRVEPTSLLLPHIVERALITKLAEYQQETFLLTCSVDLVFVECLKSTAPCHKKVIQLKRAYTMFIQDTIPLVGINLVNFDSLWPK